MKKISLLFAFFALLSTTTFAQSLNIGVRGGITLGMATGDLVPDDAKPAVGLNFAVPVEIGITENFSVQPEIQFLQKGTALKVDETLLTPEIKTRAFRDVLEIPLLAKYSIGNETIKGYAVVGPTFGFALDQHLVVITDGERESESFDFDDEGDVTDNRFDFGLAAGLGLQYKIGMGSILFDARYNFDFNDATAYEDRPDEAATYHHNNLAITVGYAIPLGGN